LEILEVRLATADADDKPTEILRDVNDRYVKVRDDPQVLDWLSEQLFETHDGAAEVQEKRARIR
jgi:hypothetical protein